MRFIILFLLCLTACKTEIVQEAVFSTPDKLSWETNAERKVWSEFLYTYFDEDFELFDKAKDNTRFCPNYSTFTKKQKYKMFGEIIAWTSFFESSWNPKSMAVDVGTPKDRNTWSIGLMQISVTDQKGFGIQSNYTFDQLLTAVPNLDLGVKIIKRQLRSRGKFILDNSDKMRYFAVLLDNNKYSKVPQITANVRKAACP